MCVFVLPAGIVLLTVSCSKLDCELQINLFVTLWCACVGSQCAGKKADFILPYRLLRALGVKGLPSLSGNSKYAFVANHWWGQYTSSPEFCRQVKRQYAYVLVIDGVSVGVWTCKPKCPPAPAESVTGKRKRAPSNNSSWVKGLPVNTLMTSQRIVGLDPGRNSLFTAVVHEQHATSSLQAAQLVKHKVFARTRSRWQEESGIKHGKLKRELWLHDEVWLMCRREAAVLATLAVGDVAGCHVAEDPELHYNLLHHQQPR